jgi:hypothetical protein
MSLAIRAGGRDRTSAHQDKTGRPESRQIGTSECGWLAAATGRRARAERGGGRPSQRRQRCPVSTVLCPAAKPSRRPVSATRSGRARARLPALLGEIAARYHRPVAGDQVCFARRYLSIIAVRDRSAWPVMSRSRGLVASAHPALVRVGVRRAGVARPYVDASRSRPAKLSAVGATSPQAPANSVIPRRTGEQIATKPDRA